MVSFLVKRIFYFIPTLFVIAVLAFGLSKLAPGDPVLKWQAADDRSGVYSKNQLIRLETQYQETKRKLGLDKPNFYFSVKPAAYPDTLYKLLLEENRVTVKNLIAQTGNWEEIQTYYHAIRDFELLLLTLPSSVSKKDSRAVKSAVWDLYLTYRHPVIESKLNRIDTTIASDSILRAHLGDFFQGFSTKYQDIKEKTSLSKLYVPSFHWHGFDNQFHNWFLNFIKGDFGYSLATKQTSTDRITPALKWTLLINLLAILLAYGISIPLGVWSATRTGSRFDKSTTLGSFMLYSLPSFWIGTMLLIFFTTQVYGMEWFQGVWAGTMDFEKFGEDFWGMVGHLVLPVLCIVYPAVAFLTRQMRSAMINVLGQDYIRTARAKGLPEHKVIWKHAFRNALFPLITMFASIFPASIVGSVAIERIFNIPGMGKLILDSCLEHDWPIVFSILMLGAVLTLVGILVADILYALVDPRVSYKKD